MKYYHNLDEGCEYEVTHILPTKGDPEYLETALEHHRDVVGDNDQLIVACGGSDPELAEIFEKYSDLIDICIHEADDCASLAVNRGILEARGKFLRFSSDDDRYDRRALDQALEAFERHPEVDFLQCGGIRVVDGENRPFYIPPDVPYGRKPEDVIRLGVTGVGFLFKRSMVARAGLWNTLSIACDGDFMMQAIERGAIVRFCRVNLFHHTLWPHSYTVGRRGVHAKDVRRLVHAYTSSTFAFNYEARALLRQVPGVSRTAQRLRAFRSNGNGATDPVWDGEIS